MLTDGKQSASESLDDVMNERVEHRQGEDWEFRFIGANQDATVTASGIGIDRDNALNIKYSCEGARQAHQPMSRSIGQAGKESDWRIPRRGPSSTGADGQEMNETD